MEEEADTCMQDIYPYYPGGIEKLVAEFMPHLANKLVQEAIANIAEKFASPAHVDLLMFPTLMT